MDRPVQKTSLLEIREFLSSHHCVPAPWETPKDVAAHLYGALCAKREDQKFWFELQDLVNRLDDLRFDRAAFDGADAFRGTTLSHLMTDLRNSLDGGSRGGGIRRWASRSLCVAALFSFLLLGVAVGCGTQSDDEVSYQTCPEAEYQDISGFNGAVFCELVEIIDEADLPTDLKYELLECLPKLDADYREQLLVLFQTMDDETISEFLNNPTTLCASDDDSWNDDDDH